MSSPFALSMNCNTAFWRRNISVLRTMSEGGKKLRALASSVRTILTQTNLADVSKERYPMIYYAYSDPSIYLV
ncbi:Telomere-associated protein [Trichinella pseudospiralis]